MASGMSSQARACSVSVGLCRFSAMAASSGLTWRLAAPQTPRRRSPSAQWWPPWWTEATMATPTTTTLPWPSWQAGS
eukprot:5584305-Alexandrium_andersonii.AAC.1